MDNLTKHGIDRVAERSGAKDVGRFISRVLRNGKSLEHYTNKQMRQYLTKIVAKSGEGRFVRVLGQQAFLFNINSECITVLNIPSVLFQRKGRGGDCYDEQL